VAVLIVAVLIVEVAIVSVLTDSVPIVTVPVEAVMLEPNVDAPSTANVPVLLTPVVEIWRADTPASSPLDTAASVAPTIFDP